MKKIILVVGIASLLIVGCKEAKKEVTKNGSLIEKKEDHKDSKIGFTLDKTLISNNWLKEIKSNGDSKWLADQTTHTGVKKLSVILEKSKPLNVNEYHQLANDLNVVKNEIIQKCTMKGPAHDNLHTWLLPLITKVEVLSKVTNATDGARVKAAIDENVIKYYNYFDF